MNLKEKLFYLATAYSHPDESMREFRFRMACDVAGFLMAKGFNIFSPIAHTHPIAVRCELPKGWDYWGQYDQAVIARCDAMITLISPGWDVSKGMAAEIEIANQLGKPIYTLVYEIDLETAYKNSLLRMHHA